MVDIRFVQLTLQCYDLVLCAWNQEYQWYSKTEKEVSHSKLINCEFTVINSPGRKGERDCPLPGRSGDGKNHRTGKGVDQSLGVLTSGLVLDFYGGRTQVLIIGCYERGKSSRINTTNRDERRRFRRRGVIRRSFFQNNDNLIIASVPRRIGNRFLAKQRQETQ